MRSLNRWVNLTTAALSLVQALCLTSLCMSLRRVSLIVALDPYRRGKCISHVP
jgi:hypothetical protein